MNEDYKMVRLRKGDYERLKDLQEYIRRKGTDAIDRVELGRQPIIETGEMGEDGLSLGRLCGLGAAALAYLIWKNQ